MQASTEETVTRGYMLQTAASQIRGPLAVALVAVVLAYTYWRRTSRREPLAVPASGTSYSTRKAGEPGEV
ncbi:hypothetical protein AB0E83_03445 [Streptomyces sp. NPDC035033]|uniref:hypothetical protein n=1 Tax=Streptomyces sp. NPDC035033 TaxID=3155368 RepID=UPI0033FFC4DC